MGFNNNDDDFNFEDDDLFGGDDDPFADNDPFGDDAGADDFSFDDDPFGDEADAADFDFDDDELGEADFDPDLGVQDEEPDLMGDEVQEGGASSGFRRGLIALGILLLVQIGVIVFLFYQGGQEERVAFEATVSARETQNAILIGSATAESGTANAIATTETFRLSVTPTATPTATNTEPPTFTPTPTVLASNTPDATDQAGTALAISAQETADAEQDEVAQQQTQAAVDALTQAAEQQDSDLAAIDATATALVELFDSLTQQAQDDPDADATQPTIAPTRADTGQVPQREDELPDAGLFDNMGAGSSLGMVVLAAFGLLGVIAFSRRMRQQIETDDE